MIKKILWGVWLLACFAGRANAQGISPALGAGLMEIQSTATQPIIAGNSAAARAKALDQALSQAVAEALGQLLGRDASSRRLELFSNLVLKSRDDYLLTHKVLSEGPGDQEYTLRISATIKGKTLNDWLEKLGVSRSEGGLPTLAVYYCLGAAADEKEMQRGERFRKLLDKTGAGVLAFHPTPGCPPFPYTVPPELPAMAEDRKHFDLLLFLRLRPKGDEPGLYLVQGEFLLPNDNSLKRLPNQACPAAEIDPAAPEADREEAMIKPCALAVAGRLLEVWSEKSRRYTNQELVLRNLRSGRTYRQVNEELIRGLPRLARLTLLDFRQGEIRLSLSYEGTRPELQQKMKDLFQQVLPGLTLEQEADQTWVASEKAPGR